jgi:putative pyruvate formate lyase activating enzyme
MYLKNNITDWDLLLEPLKELENCNICPRNCGANRFSDKLGYCKSDASFNIASVCIHKGEEPVISGKQGICNIFFSHCNMQCIYCQNYQISHNKNNTSKHRLALKEVIKKIIIILDSGCNSIGFVSPSHFIPQVKIIINTLHKLGRYPIVVFNTNSYDKVAILKDLQGLVDVYLADFKYLDKVMSKEYSDTPNYSEIATRAIKEMYRQKKSVLRINNRGEAESGLIIRHLVLPGHIDNSIDILRFIAKEISTSVYISLMSQYYPTERVKKHKFLGNVLKVDEYNKVVKKMKLLGFTNGWIQNIDSNSRYMPNFKKNNPFE